MRYRTLVPLLAAFLAVGVVAVWLILSNRETPDSGQAALRPASNVKVDVDPLPPPVPQSGWETVHLEQVTAEPDSQIDPAEVAALWVPMAKAAKENKWNAWAYVVDANTGEVILNKKGTAPHTPASTMKLLVGLVALDTLDPLGSLRTGVSVEGNNLYLWGEGDLLLAAGKGTGETNGYAGLADLAEAAAEDLLDAGIGEVSLFYQDALFEGESRYPAWAQESVAEFAGDVGPYAIDAGRTTPEGWDYVSDPSRGVANAFVAQLESNGIQVRKTKTGSAPEGAEEIAFVESAPLYEQITFMLRASDNTLAEQYCHLVAEADGAPTTFQGATENLIDQLELRGVNTDGMVASDCSGLTSTSRVTGLTLVEALEVSLDPEGGAQELIQMLPRGGLEGTLHSRYLEGPGEGNLQAKTGSLGSVSSLAGIVTTASGHDLFLAVGVDKAADWMGYQARYPIDTFVEGLAQLN